MTQHTDTQVLEAIGRYISYSAYQHVKDRFEQRAELLEALQGLVNVSDQYTGDDDEDAALWVSAQDKALAAIANATQQRNPQE